MNFASVQPVYSLITNAPSTPAPAGAHEYIADVFYPEGRRTGVRVKPNMGNIWELPLHVRPLRRGTVIPGYRVNESQIQWHATEPAHFGPCNQPGGLFSGGSQLRLMLQSATREDLLFLKKMLEGVQ
jgi:hypothetical protein